MSSGIIPTLLGGVLKRTCGLSIVSVLEQNGRDWDDNLYVTTASVWHEKRCLPFVAKMRMCIIYDTCGLIFVVDTGKLKGIHCHFFHWCLQLLRTMTYFNLILTTIYNTNNSMDATDSLILWPLFFPHCPLTTFDSPFIFYLKQPPCLHDDVFISGIP